MFNLDAALNTSLDKIADSGLVLPQGDGPVIYQGQPGSRVRLSHSTLSLMHGCERKFQKTKLLHNPNAREESPAMTFGKAYGAAAQLYMILRTEGRSVAEAVDSAIWEAFKQYLPISQQDDRRFLERCIYCIQAAQPFHERMLMEWEIPQFNGRYAAELSFCLDIDEVYYFVGYIDLVLKHRRSGRFAVTDYKSTSLTATDLTPMFKYTDQVLGYSIVLDQIAGKEQAEFETNYWVCQLLSRSISDLYQPKFTDLSFPKTLRDRMEWFLKLYLDVHYMRNLSELDVYPKRGSNCMSYNRVCTFFNGCQYTALDQPAIYIPDETEYDFTFKLDDIFANHNIRLLAPA